MTSQAGRDASSASARLGVRRSAASAAKKSVGGGLAEVDRRRIGLTYLSALALVVGVVTGFGAVVFRDLIGLIHNVLFLGQFTAHYDANLFTPPSPWGPFIILVPVIGAIAVTFIVTKFAPEARGHGVPEVMDAIYYKGGVIRPIVAVVKSLASAIAIGSGAAVGREGPIIQIGSALGSTLGQLVPMPAGERIILVAAGAGAGIAATFNTPIGGVMFAIELMMPEVSVRTFCRSLLRRARLRLLAASFSDRSRHLRCRSLRRSVSMHCRPSLSVFMRCSESSSASPPPRLFVACICLRISSTK
jgi:CIC family chloride channel protein